MSVPRAGHAAPPAMTFDQFFDSDFAKRTTVGELAEMLRAVDGEPGRVPVRYSDLDGAALAWAVAIAEGRAPILHPPTYGLPWRVVVEEAGRLFAWRPHVDWAQGGPLLDAWAVGFGVTQEPGRRHFRAFAYSKPPFQRLAGGPTLLIAACRARVRAVLGEWVGVPAELVA
mgnify:CR=1 FL=1